MNPFAHSTFVCRQIKDSGELTFWRAKFAEDFAELLEDQAAWSQQTFGSDVERGPMGPLKHLEKEARECQQAVTNLDRSELLEELADCLLLWLDAQRRAGFEPGQVVRAAQQKLLKNKARTWPKPTSDEPVEHVRGVTADDILQLFQKAGKNAERCVLFEPRPDGLLIDCYKRQYLLPYRPTKQQLDGAAEIIAVEEDAAPFSRSEIVECIEYAPEFQVGERYVVFDCELVGDEWYVGIVGKFDSKPETQASRFKRLQAPTQGLTPQQFIDRHSHAQNLFEDAADSMGQIADIFEVNGFEVTAVQQAIAELYEAKTHVVAVAPQK